jgi:GntR family transcriptional regulator
MAYKMSDNFPVEVEKNQPLHIVTYHEILRRIRSGEFQDKLPAEKQLSSILRVSRTTLRQALLVLQEDHIVETRHGSGTFIISKQAYPQRRGVEVFFTARDMLNEQAKTERLRVSIEQADELAADKLGIAPSASIVIVSRTYTASCGAYAFSADFLPLSYVEAEIGKTVQDFAKFEELVDAGIPARITTAECELVPTKAGEYIAGKLDVAQEAPILLLLQVLRDKHSQRVSLNKTYINTSKVSVNLLRKNMNVGTTGSGRGNEAQADTGR